MCGIGGVYGKNALERAHAVSRHMVHRGPDGEGSWQAPGIAIVHRRLAINDLSASGKQPMLSADGKVVITVNGEIYNYPQLRTELEAKGAKFTSTCDSEVFLHRGRGNEA